MSASSIDRRPSDLLRNWRFPVLAYCLPTAAIVVAGAFPLTNVWRAVAWATACLVMGAACLTNAVRCGRIHCFFTGPFFLAAAVAAILYGVGALPLGADGWNRLGLVLLVGAVVLMCVPEMIFGKYRAPRA
ncbi:MAG TPA: hypothetical protein VGI30_10690 [Caulobacteraceae bacterium]|jgi:hypothetical protein